MVNCMANGIQASKATGHKELVGARTIITLHCFIKRDHFRTWFTKRVYKLNHRIVFYWPSHGPWQYALDTLISPETLKGVYILYKMVWHGIWYGIWHMVICVLWANTFVLDRFPAPTNHRASDTVVTMIPWYMLAESSLAFKGFSANCTQRFGPDSRDNVACRQPLTY